MKNTEPSTKLVFESKSKPSSVVKMAVLQLVVTAVFSLALYFIFDRREALSAFFGGMIVVLANLFFAVRLFATKVDAPAPEMLMRFYISVGLKALFTIMMMAFCIIIIKVSVLPFIIAFSVAAVVINWLFILIDAKASQR